MAPSPSNTRLSAVDLSQDLSQRQKDRCTSSRSADSPRRLRPFPGRGLNWMFDSIHQVKRDNPDGRIYFTRISRLRLQTGGNTKWNINPSSLPLMLRLHG